MLTASQARETAKKRSEKLVDQTTTTVIRAIDGRSMGGYTDVWCPVQKHIAPTIKTTLNELGYDVDTCDNLGEEEINFHISWG